VIFSSSSKGSTPAPEANEAYYFMRILSTADSPFVVTEAIDASDVTEI